MRKTYVVFSRRLDGTWHPNSQWDRPQNADKRIRDLAAIDIEAFSATYNRYELLPLI